jgi:hypothetical protein
MPHLPSVSSIIIILSCSLLTSCSSREGNLSLQATGENDGALCIEYHPSTSRLCSARVIHCEILVPIPCEVCVAVALKTTCWILLEP